MILTQAQIDFYKDCGYVVFPFFAKDMCDRLLNVLRYFTDHNFAPVMNVDREVPWVQDNFVRNSFIVTVLEQLQGKEVCALMSQVIFKKSGTRYANQAWNPHQDNSYPRAKPGTYITINIFLEDADRENGCLYIYSGSHKEGLLPFEPKLSYREGARDNPGNVVVIPEKYKDRKVDLVVKKGDVLILCGETIHGSYANNSARDRPLFSVSYVNFGEPFWPGDPARSDKKVLKLH